MNVNPPDVATDPAAPPKRKRKPRAPKPPAAPRKVVDRFSLIDWLRARGKSHEAAYRAIVSVDLDFASDLRAAIHGGDEIGRADRALADARRAVESAEAWTARARAAAVAHGDTIAKLDNQAAVLDSLRPATPDDDPSPDDTKGDGPSL